MAFKTGESSFRSHVKQKSHKKLVMSYIKRVEHELIVLSYNIGRKS